MLNLSGCHISETDFKCLFDKYKTRVYSYALSITHSQSAAEDLTQEVFLKCWSCRKSLSRVNNLEHYLFTIVRNKSLNYLRNAARQKKLLLQLYSQMECPATAAADEKIIQAQHGQLLDEAVSSLSPKRRMVYQLSRNEGLNHSEIALQLHCSTNTVKNHMTEALRSIRTYLAKNDPFFVIIILLSLFILK